MNSPTATNGGKGAEAPASPQTASQAVSEPGSHSLEKPVYDPAAPSAIAVDHIVKKYGEFTAVDDISFDVKEGEASLFRPENGSYKLVVRVQMEEWPYISVAAK